MNARMLILAVAAATTLASHAGAQEYVRLTPSFNPNGNSTRPWNTLSVGAWAVGDGSQIILQPGSYFEPGIINPNRSFKITTSGGSAFIAPRAVARTSIRIASYNTHLFGQNEIPGLPRWKDAERAPHIGRIAIDEGADIFLYQEVWDPDHFLTIKGMTQAFYPSGFYGGDREGLDVLNSGLLTISKFALSNNKQVFYSDEDGTFESLASKGYTRVSFNKNGFWVTVFNTHTQSGDSSGNVEARDKQLAQLGADVNFFRLLFPDHVVLIAGDFNVSDASLQYSVTMQSVLGDFNLMGDGARNMPVAGNSGTCTTCYSNDLRRYFDPDNHNNLRIDYILYANSKDGSVRVLPKAYNVRDYEIPAGYGTICDDGICTRDLSDHYGISLDLELQRP